VLVAEAALDKHFYGSTLRFIRRMRVPHAKAQPQIQIVSAAVRQSLTALVRRQSREEELGWLSVTLAGADIGAQGAGETALTFRTEIFNLTHRANFEFSNCLLKGLAPVRQPGRNPLVAMFSLW
jgi:hypothetical protein